MWSKLINLIPLLKDIRNIKNILKMLIKFLGGGVNFITFLLENGIINKSQMVISTIKNAPEILVNKMTSWMTQNQILKMILNPKIQKIYDENKDKVSRSNEVEQLNQAYALYREKAVQVMTDSNLSLKEKIDKLKPTELQKKAMQESQLAKQAQVINFTATGKSDNVLGTCHYILTNTNRGTGKMTITFKKKPSGLGFSNASGTYTYDNIPLFVWESMVNVTKLKPNLNGGKYKWGAMHEFWELYLYAYYKTPKGKKSRAKTNEKIKATLQVKEAIKNKKSGAPVDYEKLGKIFMKFGETYGNKDFLSKI